MFDIYHKQWQSLLKVFTKTYSICYFFPPRLLPISSFEVSMFCTVVIGFYAPLFYIACCLSWSQRVLVNLRETLINLRFPWIPVTEKMKIVQDVIGAFSFVREQSLGLESFIKWQQAAFTFTFFAVVLYSSWCVFFCMFRGRTSLSCFLDWVFAVVLSWLVSICRKFVAIFFIFERWFLVVKSYHSNLYTHFLWEEKSLSCLSVYSLLVKCTSLI